MQADEKVVWATYETSWGTGRVAVSGGHLVAVDLPRLGGSSEGSGEAGVPSKEQAQRDAGEARRWAAALEEYFRGQRLAWTEEELSLDVLGLGEFERRVYAALLAVPAGTTVSYGELAEKAGYPRAARAVGNAMAANPIPVVVPCHRVVRADGSLGNYGDDPRWKPLLLEHEGRHREAER